jgi:16S rRNA (cytosine1402-N4)-methyltransferase
MSDAAHTPVLLAEVVATLQPGPGRLIADGTFGAGGYSRAFLERGANVVAFDRDPRARAFARALETDPKFRLVEDRFGAMAEHIGEGAADGVALDLGVSSMQLDEPARGFSFLRDGPLDMRMEARGPTAADLVNQAPASELTRIFREFGEEPKAGRIARAIERRRADHPCARTVYCAEGFSAGGGARRGAKVHPATRVFQALRIAVNGELDELEKGLIAAERVLKAGGRLAVVTFHSLEDRMVKSFLAARSGRTRGVSRHAPPAVVGPQPSFELIFSGAKTPGEAELAANPRARSAKLRAALRTGAPAWRAAA